MNAKERSPRSPPVRVPFKRHPGMTRETRVKEKRARGNTGETHPPNTNCRKGAEGRGGIFAPSFSVKWEDSAGNRPGYAIVFSQRTKDTEREGRRTRTEIAIKTSILGEATNIIRVKGERASERARTRSGCALK